MTNIPDHIRKKIEEEAISYSIDKEDSYDAKPFSEGASYGYSLAMQEVGEKDKEIERLKVLVQESFSEGATCATLVNQPLTKSWNEFKEKYLS